MGKRSDYKKLDDRAAWDLDKGCRRIVDQSTPCNRQLKDVFRRQARRKFKKGGDAMQDVVDAFNRANTVPQ